jgi:CRP/FNR family transcriptional regulator, cyclic AMP receptor protein
MAALMETAQTNLIRTLRRLPLFADLTEAELAVIAERVTVRRFDRGETVFSEGDACSELLIVREGSVKLLKTAANGRQQLLSVERGGNSLSEISVFDGQPYPATAETMTATTLLRVEAESFRRICLQHPAVALKVIKVLGHRLRRMSSLVEDLSFATVRGRLAAYLADIAREEGRKTAQGIEFELSENNEQLAARLGTVRELVSRNLGRLHNQGLIQMSRRTVRVPNLAALTAETSRDR